MTTNWPDDLLAKARERQSEFHRGFFRKFIGLGLLAVVINLALLGVAVWLVVSVLRWTGVIQ